MNASSPPVVITSKIVSAFVIFDQLGYGRQLGLFPPQGSALEEAMKAAFNGVTKLFRWLRT